MRCPIAKLVYSYRPTWVWTLGLQLPYSTLGTQTWQWNMQFIDDSLITPDGISQLLGEIFPQSPGSGVSIATRNTCCLLIYNDLTSWHRWNDVEWIGVTFQNGRTFVRQLWWIFARCFFYLQPDDTVTRFMYSNVWKFPRIHWFWVPFGKLTWTRKRTNC